MPEIGSEMWEILRIWETKQFCIDSETNGRVQSIEPAVSEAHTYHY